MLVTAAFTISLWLADLINLQVKKSRSISPSMQVGLAKFSKFFLVTVAFLVALNAAGINMSSLAVFGGALGVGLGLGLQRIASNFISGFILVLDRSVKPGDLITVGDNFGRVEQLNARYVVLRNRQRGRFIDPKRTFDYQRSGELELCRSECPVRFGCAGQLSG